MQERFMMLSYKTTMLLFTTVSLLLIITEVSSSKSSKSSRKHNSISRRSRHCTKSKPFIDCDLAPCKAERMFDKKCNGYLKAKCINHYCGGCVARYFHGNKEVQCGNEGKGVICELHNTSLSCPLNHLLRIKHANYGRTDTTTCRHSYNLDEMHNNIRCFSRNATSIVSELCEGRTICWPDVSNGVFGDPCYGIYKYLQVDYDCVPARNYFKKVPEESGMVMELSLSEFAPYSAATRHTVFHLMMASAALLWFST